MKIIFDTNILISGFLTVTGLPQYVFNLAIKRHTVILSEFILEELESKLTSKLGAPKSITGELIHFLRSRAVVLDISHISKFDFGDKKDWPILSLIETAKANYFITGDKKLLSLKKLGATLFLNPREAVEVL